MVYRNSAADCLRPPLSDTLPVKCQQLRKGFGECRRGMIDMRKRFRGNQPAAAKMLQTSPDDSSSTSSGEHKDKDGYQLYAGRSAFGGLVKETSGNEKEAPDWRELENQKYRNEQAAKKS
jgi:cytochrome c oxidase assembly factor 5